MLIKIFKIMVIGIYMNFLCFLIPYNGICEEQKTWTEPVTGMVFIWVPAACYLMGYGDWVDNDYFITPSGDETFVHKVCLDGFWLGKYEVTQAQ